jgi:DNA-binding XRE family transcriptional regulator
MTVTADQVKAARTLLNWSQMSLANAAGVNVQAVVAFEIHRLEVPETAVASIKAALEQAGVEFPEGEPVRMRK